jgi:hypothetical protein
MTARATITTQQNRITQMTKELARVKQSHISSDQTGSLKKILFSFFFLNEIFISL